MRVQLLLVNSNFNPLVVGVGVVVPAAVRSLGFQSRDVLLNYNSNKDLIFVLKHTNYKFCRWLGFPTFRSTIHHDCKINMEVAVDFLVSVTARDSR